MTRLFFALTLFLFSFHLNGQSTADTINVIDSLPLPIDALTNDFLNQSPTQNLDADYYTDDDAREIAKRSYIEITQAQLEHLDAATKKTISDIMQKAEIINPKERSSFSPSSKKIELAVAPQHKYTALDYLQRLYIFQVVLQSTVIKNDYRGMATVNSIEEASIFGARQRHIRNWEWAYLYSLPKKMRTQIIEDLTLGNKSGDLYGYKKATLIASRFENADLDLLTYLEKAREKGDYPYPEEAAEQYKRAENLKQLKAKALMFLSFCAGMGAAVSLF